MRKISKNQKVMNFDYDHRSLLKSKIIRSGQEDTKKSLVGSRSLREDPPPQIGSDGEDSSFQLWENLIQEDYYQKKKKEEEKQVARVLVEVGVGVNLFHEHSRIKLSGPKYGNRLVSVFTKTLRKLQVIVSGLTGKKENFQEQKIATKRRVLINCRNWMSPQLLQTFFKTVCLTFDLRELSQSHFIDLFPTNRQLLDLFQALKSEMAKTYQDPKTSHLQDILLTINKHTEDEIYRILPKAPSKGHRPLSPQQYHRQIVQLFADFGTFQTVLEKIGRMHPKLDWHIDDLENAVNDALMKGLVKALKIDLQKGEKDHSYKSLRLSKTEMSRVVTHSKHSTKVLLARIYLARSYCTGMVAEFISQVRLYLLNKKIFKYKTVINDS